MFLILPIGHDQPVYDRPWMTIGLVTSCVAAFLVSWVIGSASERAMLEAIDRVEAIHEAHPRARVSFQVEGLPAPISSALHVLSDPNPARVPIEGDAELDAAMRDLVTAMSQLPTLRYGYRPGHPTVRGALGHAFMHADVFHLFGNMLLLWVAGGVLECFWRRWAYALLYVTAAVVGLVAHHLSAPDSLAPLIGASGAVAGLIGAFVVSYPRARVRIGYFFLLIVKPIYGSWYVPAWVVIPLWGLNELAHALLGVADGVAYWAHVGGIACGLATGVAARLFGWIAVDAGHDAGVVEVPLSASEVHARLARREEAAQRRASMPAPAMEDLPLPDLSDLPIARDRDDRR